MRLLLHFTNFADFAMGNIVSRVLHIIREEDNSLTTSTLEGLGIVGNEDDESHIDRDDHHISSSPAVVAAASRSTLTAPLLHTLLEDLPAPVSVPNPPSSGGDSEERSKCTSKADGLDFVVLSLRAEGLCA